AGRAAPDRTRRRLRHGHRYGPFARRSRRTEMDRARLQRRLLDFDEMRPDLTTRRAVDAEPRDRPIPLPEERLLRVETVKAATVERFGFHVAAAALLLPICCGVRGCVGSGVKPQCVANAR